MHHPSPSSWKRQQRTFQTREHVKKTCTLIRRVSKGGGDVDLTLRTKTFFQNHPFQVFLVSKTYIFIHVKIIQVFFTCSLTLSFGIFYHVSNSKLLLSFKTHCTDICLCLRKMHTFFK